MRRVWKVLGFLVIALLVIGTASARTVEHCPDGWVAKYEIGGGWEIADGVAFSGGLAGNPTLANGLTDAWSSTHTLTGFCAKYSTENTGILELVFPWLKPEQYDISHYVLYAEEGEPTPTPTPTNTPTPTPTDEPTPTPTPTLTPTPPCTIKYYELEGLTYHCYLTRNPLTDEEYVLPSRFNGTDYMQTECNKLFTCTVGWTTGNFIWNGEVNFLCELPCLDCYD